MLISQHTHLLSSISGSVILVFVICVWIPLRPCHEGPYTNEKYVTTFINEMIVWYLHLRKKICWNMSKRAIVRILILCQGIKCSLFENITQTQEVNGGVEVMPCTYTYVVVQVIQVCTLYYVYTNINSLPAYNMKCTTLWHYKWWL